MNNIKTSPYDVIAIFPLPIYKTNIEREFTKQEQDEFYAIISDQQGMKGNNGPEKNVSNDKYLLNRKSFLSIHSFIQHHLKEFATTVIGIDAAKTNWSPHITQSWLNVYKPGHHDPPHNHRNSIISGVFYINCLKNLAHGKSDGIIFGCTTHKMQQELNVHSALVEDTKFSDKPHPVSIVEGDLVLFPSTTQHAVTLNETSNQNRISLAFDVI